MATTAPIPNENAAAVTQKSSGVLVPILCSMMASLLVGGGVIFFLLHSGKLGGSAPAQVIVVAPKAEPTEPVTMDPFLVNLADAGGHSYLRATMVLELTVPPSTDKKAEKKPEGKPDADPAVASERAAMRDTVLTVLGGETADQLLAAGGKDALKKTLMEQLNKAQMNSTGDSAMRKVKDIYFTEFLVQR